MDFNILTAINDILKEDGFMKSNEQSAKLDYKDIIQTQICFFRLPASDQCHLEVHIVNYAGDSHNITVLLQLPNDERIFCGSAFVQEKSTMREQIVQLFQVPVNKLSNALNPAVKCITNDLIRNNIFKHLGTRHVTRLELVCFWFRCALLTTSVDHDFWRPHFQREYENEDPQPAEPPGLTFRERYFARKRLLLEFTRPGTGFLAIRRGTPSLPAFFTDPPLPILPPRPMQPRPIPEPHNPLMPLQPGAHQPGGGRFRLPPFLGDFDNQNNLPPGARPQGDPLFRDPHPLQLQPDDTEPRPPVILRQAGGGTGRFNPFGQNPRGSGGASSSGFGFGGGGGFI